MMPNGDPWNRFFDPTLTLMIDSYIIQATNAESGYSCDGPEPFCETIRIHHECEGGIEKTVPRSRIGITKLA